MLTALATGTRPERGLLFSFEGIDGAGKTTSIRRLRGHLERAGYRVHVFKLPSREAKQLALFRDYKQDPLTAEPEGRVDILAMFLAVTGDRLNTISTRIMPLLERGDAVIVDRFLYSALCEAIISSSRITPRRWGLIAEVVAEFPTPHVAFFNRVSIIEAKRRIHSRPDERDLPIDTALFNRRIDTFERLRRQFSGVLIDTALDDHSCFKIMTRACGVLLEAGVRP